ncbi:MAG TPA: hypothetical protein VFO67_01325 [Gemmatimonadales bacterium]|nr:hypothetical protein [Gemmatimonadales bacterium]
MKSSTRWLLVCSLTLVPAAQAVAQAAPPAAPPASPAADNTELVLQKIRADKKLLVSESMALTADEATKFWPVYDAFQAELVTLNQRAVTLIESYAANATSMTDAAATRMTDDFVRLEQDRAALLQTYRPKFSKVLPPIKVARYYQIENKIRAIVNFELAKGIPLM